MLKAISKVVVLTIMLVAFISQAMAFNTSMPCESADDEHQNALATSQNLSPSVLTNKVLTHSVSTDSVVKGSDSTVIDADNHGDCCGIECCDLDCGCITNTCTSVVYFTINAATIKAVALGENLYLQQLVQPQSLSTSLYRPPIFTA